MKNTTADSTEAKNIDKKSQMTIILDDEIKAIKQLNTKAAETSLS